KGRLKSQKDIEDYFQSQGTSLATIRRQWQLNFMATEYLRNRAFPVVEQRVNNAAIREYYDEHRDEFKAGDKAESSDIPPFDEKVQKEIRDKLRNEISQREMKRVVAELKREAVIEYPGGR